MIAEGRCVVEQFLPDVGQIVAPVCQLGEILPGHLPPGVELLPVLLQRLLLGLHLGQDVVGR